MPTDVSESRANKRCANEKRGSVGVWEMHCWGDGMHPGMAVVSAITTLQIGATLTPSPIDKIALNKAVEYLMVALASQLRSFQQTSMAEL
jgi:hypothetical protein